MLTFDKWEILCLLYVTEVIYFAKAKIFQTFEIYAKKNAKIVNLGAKSYAQPVTLHREEATTVEQL